MPHSSLKQALGRRRHRRVRARVHGTAVRPRLVVFRSLKHLSVQVINDDVGQTLASATDREVPGQRTAATVTVGQAVGKLIAERARAAGVTTVVFDRGRHAYHGQVRAVADGAREGGLEF